MGMNSKIIPWAVILLGVLVAGNRLPNGFVRAEGSAPFALFLVPARSQEEPWGRGISMATDTNDRFYVILTNVSEKTQFAFEQSNSWGYYAISFEMETEDGRKYTISRRLSRKAFVFTRNWPGLFVIPPGESMVFSLLLDDYWGAEPDVPIADRTPMTAAIRAIYQLDATPESVAGHVWTGRLESRSYHLKFRHWISRNSPE